MTFGLQCGIDACAALAGGTGFAGPATQRPEQIGDAGHADAY